MILCILDGWGLASTWRGNAIAFANPPVFSRLWRAWPHAVLATTDRAAKPPARIDSELAHATIGAGRWIRSDLEEISSAISQGLFIENPVLADGFRAAAQKKRTVHLIGLVSEAAVESDLSHLRALLLMARNYQAPSVLIHAITDGLDGLPRSALAVVRQIADFTREVGVGTLASVIGRNDALDITGSSAGSLRAYRLWVMGEGAITHDLAQAVREQYAAGLTDRFLPPLRIPAAPEGEPIIHDDDIVIVWNSRGERIAPLVRAFLDSQALRPFLRRAAPLRKLTKFISLVTPAASRDLPIDVAFPPATIPATLPEILAGRGLRQLRIGAAETQSVLTTFLSGGRESPFPNEERRFLSRAEGSPDGLVTELNRAFRHKPPDVVFVNINAVDRVAHGGDLFATAAAVRAVDAALASLVETVTAQRGTLLITADHGNGEEILPAGSRQPNRRHTGNPVPLLLVARDHERNLMKQAIALPFNLAAGLARPSAGLPDIAPTILELFGIPTPVEMTGQSLVHTLQS